MDEINVMKRIETLALEFFKQFEIRKLRRLDEKDLHFISSGQEHHRRKQEKEEAYCVLSFPIIEESETSKHQVNLKKCPRRR
jgi:hypothetical protein